MDRLFVDQELRSLGVCLGGLACVVVGSPNGSANKSRASDHHCGHGVEKLFVQRLHIIWFRVERKFRSSSLTTGIDSSDMTRSFPEHYIAAIESGSVRFLPIPVCHQERVVRIERALT